MYDANGIPPRRRVKNSTLLRSRVEFQIKSFCFFHCLLDRGHFTSNTTDGFFSRLDKQCAEGIGIQAKINVFPNTPNQCINRNPVFNHYPIHYIPHSLQIDGGCSRSRPRTISCGLGRSKIGAHMDLHKLNPSIPCIKVLPGFFKSRVPRVPPHPPYIFYIKE